MSRIAGIIAITSASMVVSCAAMLILWRLACWAFGGGL